MNITCLFFSFSAAAAACAGTVATCGRYPQSAVCAEHPMVAGAHYVEMTLLEKGRYGARMGVVGQGFDAAGGRRAYQSAEGWLLDTNSGYLCHAGSVSTWEGRPQPREIKPGDVVGLLLDLGQRTLSVYLNGARRGVMVAPETKDYRGEAVAPLAGPLRWAVDVNYGASVRIAAAMPPLPPPLCFSVAGPQVVLSENGNALPSPRPPFSFSLFSPIVRETKCAACPLSAIFLKVKSIIVCAPFIIIMIHHHCIIRAMSYDIDS